MKIRYIILILAGLFMVSLLADRSNNVFNTDRARWIAALDWSLTAVGVVIAAASAVRLLMASLQGATLRQIMPAVVAFFAGVMMFQRFWAVPISFACVLICWLVVEHYRPPGKKD